MKKLIAFLLCLYSSVPMTGYTQTLKKTYYDIYKTTINEEFYVNSKGEKNGKYKEYTREGIVDVEANYKNGQLDGLCMEYFTSDGRQLIKSKVNYINGMREGEAFYYNHVACYPSPIIQAQGKYMNDKKEGSWTKITWYSNYYVKKMENEKDCYFVKSTVYYENDEEVSPTSGKEIRTFFPSGKPNFEGIYGSSKDGNSVFIGDKISYYPNGQEDSHDKMDSLGIVIYHKSWYPNGKLKLLESWENGTYTEEGYNEDGSPDRLMQNKIDESNKKKNHSDGLITADVALNKGDYSTAMAIYNDIGERDKANAVQSLYNAFDFLKDKNYPDAKRNLDKAKGIISGTLLDSIDNAVGTWSRTVEEFGSIKKQLDEKYMAYDKLFVEEKNSFFVDANNQPIKKKTYPKGEYLFEKTNSIITEIIKKVNAADTQPQDGIVSGREAIKILDRMITLGQGDTKELNKQVKKIDTKDEIQKIVGW